MRPAFDEAMGALADGRWGEASAGLKEWLAGHPDDAGACEGLAEAHWWLCDAAASARARERAYVLFRDAGDHPRACRAAIDLAITYLISLGNPAASQGWLGRAERILPEGSAGASLAGWIALLKAFMSSADGRLDEIRGAIDVARACRDVDLELVAMSDLGLLLVADSRVDEGFALLDEAMAGTLGGEYKRLDTVVYCSCNMMSACCMAGDYERAAHWCRVADDFMDRYGSPFLYARCRVHYGGVLVARGNWPAAEDELQAVVNMTTDAGPGPRDEALARLADLRFRQGRLEEADALLSRFDGPARAPLAVASVRLATGEVSVAVALLEQRCEVLPDRHVEAPETWGLLVAAYLAAGTVDRAASAAARLDEVARVQQRGFADATAAHAAGLVAAARGDQAGALTHLHHARSGFAAVGFPLEGARACLASARLRATASPELAAEDARTALSVFTELGAAGDADAAAALLRSLGVRGRPAPRTPTGLTTREQEVLRLVGLGLSNPEIAARLYISRKTAAHHVSRVLSKLGVRNRAEAVAYAARHGVQAGRR